MMVPSVGNAVFTWCRRPNLEPDEVFERMLDEFIHHPDDEYRNRLKGWQGLAQNMRSVFTRMGFTDQEMVVLICGGHVFGRGHRQHTGRFCRGYVP